LKFQIIYFFKNDSDYLILKYFDFFQSENIFIFYLFISKNYYKNYNILYTDSAITKPVETK